MVSIYIDPRTGEKIEITLEPDDGFGFGPKIIPEENAKITKYFVAAKNKAIYLYDFGDGWEHEIVLEKIIPAEPNVQYPRCVARKRACLLDDCGGIWGYDELLRILSDPEHDRYNERMEWMEEIGRSDFNPDDFDSRAVDLNRGLW